MNTMQTDGTLPPEQILAAAAGLLQMSPEALKAALATAGTPKQPDVKLLSRKEAAIILHVSYKTVKEWTLAGRLPQIKFGHRTSRYRESDVLEFLHKHEQLRNEESPR